MLELKLPQTKLEINYNRAKIITKNFVRSILPIEQWRDCKGRTWEQVMKEGRDDTLGMRTRFSIRM